MGKEDTAFEVPNRYISRISSYYLYPQKQQLGMNLENGVA